MPLAISKMISLSQECASTFLRNLNYGSSQIRKRFSLSQVWLAKFVSCFPHFSWRHLHLYSDTCVPLFFFNSCFSLYKPKLFVIFFSFCPANFLHKTIAGSVIVIRQKNLDTDPQHVNKYLPCTVHSSSREKKSALYTGIYQFQFWVLRNLTPFPSSFWAWHNKLLYHQDFSVDTNLHCQLCLGQKNFVIKLSIT